MIHSTILQGTIVQRSLSFRKRCLISRVRRTRRANRRPSVACSRPIMHARAFASRFIALEIIDHRLLLEACRSMRANSRQLSCFPAIKIFLEYFSRRQSRHSLHRAAYFIFISFSSPLQSERSLLFACLRLFVNAFFFKSRYKRYISR